MMHICTVATLCFPEKTVPRNYYYCVQDDNSLCLCFKSMYRTLFVAIFTSTFIFSMSKSSHTYRNINISNQLCQGSLPISRSLIGRPGTKKKEAGEFKVRHKLQPLRSSSRGPRQASNYPVRKCDLGFIGSRGRELLKDFHRHPYSISLMIASWRRPAHLRL